MSRRRAGVCGGAAFSGKPLPILPKAGQVGDHLKFEISMMTRRLRQAVLATGLTLAVAIPARADEHWIKLPTAPYTLNNKQDAIAFADVLTGWYGNGTGRIYRTHDAGAAWPALWTNHRTHRRAPEFAHA